MLSLAAPQLMVAPVISGAVVMAPGALGGVVSRALVRNASLTAVERFPAASTAWTRAV